MSRLLKSKRLWMMVMLVTIAVVIAFTLMQKNDQIERPIEVAVNTLNTRDVSKIIDAYHPYFQTSVLWGIGGEVNKKTGDADLKIKFDNFVQKTKDEFGNDFKITYKITDMEKQDSETVELYENKVHDWYNVYAKENGKIKIQEFALVTTECTVSGNQKTETGELEPFRLFKIDGKWYLSDEGYGMGVLWFLNE